MTKMTHAATGPFAEAMAGIECPEPLCRHRLFRDNTGGQTRVSVHADLRRIV